MIEKDFSLFQIVVVLIKRKYLLIANFFFIFIVTIVISLFLQKSYKSSVVFIPPGQSSSGILSMLGNNFSPELFMGSELSKRQYISLLHSRELREKLINKFNLIKIYKLEKMKNRLDIALKILDKNILIKENEEGGLGITDVISVEVTVIDINAQRASDMANEIFSLLEEKALIINQRESCLKIIFFIEQLKKDDSLLSLARITLKEFQKKNKVYDISSQAKSTARVIAQLEADKMTIELQKSLLQQSFSSNNIEINSLSDKIAIYNSKIRELEQQNNQSIMPGLQKSLDLADEYADLFKEVETYLQLNISLRQQLEIAKVKQQKNYSGISLVDCARPAQYKFKPKRAIFVLVLTFLYMTLILTWLLFREYYQYVRKNHPEKMEQLLKALR
jgi:tyrosine-protein kinase Etk/Wzc